MATGRSEGGSAAARPGDRREGGGRVPFVEKLTAGLGLALVLAAAGSMAYEALFGTSSPPDIVVEVVAVHPVSAGFAVEIRSVNLGGTTGAQVRIEGRLLDGDRPVEVSSTILSYVPDRSRQLGGLYFRHDPSRHRLEVRATGYQEP